MQPRRSIGIVVLLALVGAGAALATQDDHRSSRAGEREATVTVIEGGFNSWGFIVSDDRQLVAHADNIFVGEIVAHLGTILIPSTDSPISGFSVRVETVIKGGLSGEITVIQWGGIHPDTGELWLEENDQLLIPGQRYLLVTVSESDLGFIGQEILAHGIGDVLIRDSAHELELTNRFRRAADLPEITPTATGSATATGSPQVGTDTKGEVKGTVDGLTRGALLFRGRWADAATAWQRPLSRAVMDLHNTRTQMWV